MWCVVAIFLAVAASAQAADEDWQPPSWCHGHECPRFKTVKTDHGVDLRSYGPSKWIITNASAHSWDEAYDTAKKRLDEYWQGDNLQKAKIDRTVPLFTMFYPTGEGEAMAGDMTFEYYLPAELHDAPPAPKAPEVKVLDVPGYNVWIRVFGGFPDGKEIRKQGFGFMDQLEHQMGVKVQRTQFGFAQYDDPIHLVNRHNEIWVWEQTSPSMSVMERVKEELLHIQQVLGRHGLPVSTA